MAPNGVRQGQGGGETLPRIERPREEERGSETVGLFARMRCGGIREEERPRRGSKAPGRRRGAPKLLGFSPE
jgi:hypothetical protein